MYKTDLSLSIKCLPERVKSDNFLRIYKTSTKAVNIVWSKNYSTNGYSDQGKAGEFTFQLVIRKMVAVAVVIFVKRPSQEVEANGCYIEKNIALAKKS